MSQKRKDNRIIRKAARNMTDFRAKLRGVANGTSDWDILYQEAKMQMTDALKTSQFFDSYVDAGLRQDYCKLLVRKRKRDNKHNFYKVRYKDEMEEKESKISIYSTTQNIKPTKVRWCIKARSRLINNATPAEQAVWNVIKQMKIQKVFQQTFYIYAKIYFADFFLPEYSTIIEIDGSVHDKEGAKLYDSTRTVFLNSLGIKVVRIPNEETQKEENIIALIKNIIKEYKSIPKKERFCLGAL